MNYASKISLAMPFVSALIGVIAARDAKAGILMVILSTLGGFIVGACIGAFSVGLANVLLTSSSRYKSQLCIVGFGIAYFILPVILLAAACIATIFGLRLIL